MTNTRRTFLAIAGTGLAGILGRGLSGRDISADADNDVDWFRHELARTRSPRAEELADLRDSIFLAARELGYPSERIAATDDSPASMSVNPDGNSVGKIAIVLNSTDIISLTKEYRTDGPDRQVFAALWANEGRAGGLDPTLHAAALSADSVNQASATMARAQAAACCSHVGAPRTCCQIDLQGIFECCGPCAFTLPAAPAFIACALIWCNYCYNAHCDRWYVTC